MLLSRLSTPGNRLVDLSREFGGTPGTISDMLDATVDHLDSMAGILSRIQAWKPYLHDFMEAFTRKDCVLPGLFGLVDGTLHPIARPGGHQNLQVEVYNGWKRTHAIKFQSVVAPNGMIIHLSDPWPANRHDITMYRQSGVGQDVAAMGAGMQPVPCLYGDPAYIGEHTVTLHSPYKGANNTLDEDAFNKAMQPLRLPVEWVFGAVKTQWGFLREKGIQKLCQNKIGTHFKVAVLLYNAHVALYGSQTSKYFECPPLSLEEYTAL